MKTGRDVGIGWVTGSGFCWLCWLCIQSETVGQSLKDGIDAGQLFVNSLSVGGVVHGLLQENRLVSYFGRIDWGPKPLVSHFKRPV